MAVKIKTREWEATLTEHAMPAGTPTRIARAALLVFLKEGITGATVKEIARAADLSEGALYRHYVSKDEIALQLFERQHRVLTVLVERALKAPGPLAARVKAVVEAYCAAADADWELFAFHLVNQNLLLRTKEKRPKNPVEIVRASLEEAARQGEIAAGDFELLTASALGVVLQPALHKVYGRWHGSMLDQAPYFTMMICRVLNIRAD